MNKRIIISSLSLVLVGSIAPAHAGGWEDSPAPREKSPSNNAGALPTEIVIKNEQAEYPGANFNSDTTNNVNQNQNAQGNARAVASPNIAGQSNISNQVVNTGYGELPRECIIDVACKTPAHLDLSIYYGRSDYGSGYDSFYDSNHNNYGVVGRIMIPLGGFGERMDKVVDLKIEEDQLMNTRLQQEIIATNLKIDKEALLMCINVKNTGKTNKRATIDYENASPMLRRIYEICQGLEIEGVTLTPPPYVPTSPVVEPARPVRGLW